MGPSLTSFVLDGTQYQFIEVVCVFFVIHHFRCPWQMLAIKKRGCDADHDQPIDDGC